MGILAAKNEIPRDILDSLEDEALYEAAKKLGQKAQDYVVTTPNNSLKKAGARGTDVHDLAEKLLVDGKLPPKNTIPEEQLPYVEGLWAWYKKWIREKGCAVEMVETPVYSLEHGFAGTFDALLLDTINGEPLQYHLIDFKTSKAIYETHLLQPTAYKGALIERGWCKHNAPIVPTAVRLGNDGTYETKVSPFVYENFLNIKKVYDFMEPYLR